MRYLSTRGAGGSKSFQDIILEGMAPDGGLYLPDHYPSIKIEAAKNYLEVAKRVMAPFAPGIDLEPLLESAWSSFPKDDPAPLKKLGRDLYLMELFHGPTLSFKDFGLQFLGALFEQFAATPINIIGATSGDTGAAAVHALKGKKGIRLFMLHPRGKISELQRKQMTTVNAPGIFNIAVEGNFDDCQRLLKQALATGNFTTVNSINWGRILAQTTYLWLAALKLGAKAPVHFVVPTGNFGNAFSGYVAMRSGAPISGITIATNTNDILPRAFETGVYKPGKAVATISPAMDIQVAGNFERLLFEGTGRNPEKVLAAAKALADHGEYKIPGGALREMSLFFKAGSASEDQTRAALQVAYKEFNEILDPHTGVGLAVCTQLKTKTPGPTVLLVTAHPGKFPVSLDHTNLKSMALPAALTSLMEAPESCHTLPADARDLENFLKDKTHDS